MRRTPRLGPLPTLALRSVLMEQTTTSCTSIYLVAIRTISRSSIEQRQPWRLGPTRSRRVIAESQEPGPRRSIVWTCLRSRVKGLWVRPVQLAQRVPLVRQVRPEPLVLRVPRVERVQLAPRVRPVLPVRPRRFQVRQDLQVRLVQLQRFLAQRVQPGLRVPRQRFLALPGRLVRPAQRARRVRRGPVVVGPRRMSNCFRPRGTERGTNRLARRLSR